MYVVVHKRDEEYFDVGVFTPKNGYFTAWRTRSRDRAFAVCSYLNGGNYPEYWAESTPADPMKKQDLKLMIDTFV